MAVTNIYWLPEGRTGGIDADGYRTYQRQALVRTSDKLDGPKTVDAGVGVALYAPYVDGNDSDPWALCKSRDAAGGVDGDPLLWKYTLKYDSRPIANNVTYVTGPGDNLLTGTVTPAAPQQQGQTAPLDRKWAIRLFAASEQRPLLKDFNTVPKAVKNSANLPYSPGLTHEVGIPAFQITAYVPAFNYGKIETYFGTSNKTTFLGFTEGKLKCVDYQAQSQFEQGVFFWEVQVTIHQAPAALNYTWDVEVLDQGTIERVGAEYRVIKDNAGQPVTEPVPLDGAGLKLAPGSPLVYETFRPVPRTAWTNLI